MPVFTGIHWSSLSDKYVALNQQSTILYITILLHDVWKIMDLRKPVACLVITVKIVIYSLIGSDIIFFVVRNFLSEPSTM